MSLRWKIALAMAAIAASTAMLFGAASYRATRSRLLSEVDRSLTAVEGAYTRQRANEPILPDRGPLQAFDARFLDADGVVIETTFEVTIPVTEDDLALVGVRASRFSTVSTEAGGYRVRTVGLRGGVFQVGRSLGETDRVLASVRARTVLLAALLTGLAAVLGLWIAGRVTASLRRLTAAAEHVGSTGRLDVSVGGGGTDEVGRLSTAFDRMLAALARSKEEQRRLVQDAGHELRTPLTSLLTNLDVLRRHPGMDATQRDVIVDDLHAETRELSALVDEVVAVASGLVDDEPATTFDLVGVVRELADRTARRADRAVTVYGPATGLVTARRAAVHRAVSCLLDNAVKFDPGHGPIEVEVGERSVSVADRGIGIGPDDVQRAFDRFYRSDEARTMPGSGLGLSIVRDVAEAHGGEAFAAPRPGGGTVVGFRIGIAMTD